MNRASIAGMSFTISMDFPKLLAQHLAVILTL
jgi:hypothetical protein